jgi:nicotinate phosphoribosyltransferase
MSGSRAAYIGGCTGTSNVLAGKVFGIPVNGTHAHSWVMCFPSELEAFEAYAEVYPDRCLLLVDTYDTLSSGVPNAIKVFTKLMDKGREVRAAIRLDSGDLALQSKAAHRMLEHAGFHDPLIVASNDLDAELIADLKRQKARINAWGVGTHLITSHDNPALSGVYKLTAVRDEKNWKPKIKISSNIEKTTDPGIKKLVRYYDRDHVPLGDVLYLVSEPVLEDNSLQFFDRQRLLLKHTITGIDHWEELLVPAFKDGKSCLENSSIHEIRENTIKNIARLPGEMKRLRYPHIYQVLLSPELCKLKKQFLENHV